MKRELDYRSDMKVFKVLNNYAGLGGNRKRWAKKILINGEWYVVKVTAVELNPVIAKIYQDFFPDDDVIVGDAAEYLAKHYDEFDFIWASPPCQSHSVLNHVNNVAVKRMEREMQKIKEKHIRTGNNKNEIIYRI